MIAPAKKHDDIDEAIDAGVSDLTYAENDELLKKDIEEAEKGYCATVSDLDCRVAKAVNDRVPFFVRCYRWLRGQI